MPALYMNKALFSDQLPHEGGAMSPDQLIVALPPGECFILLNPNKNDALVCQLARSADGLTWYVAGPRFNGDEVVNLSNLMLAGEIPLYNDLHRDQEQRIYLCSSPEEAAQILRILFELYNAR